VLLQRDPQAVPEAVHEGEIGRDLSNVQNGSVIETRFPQGIDIPFAGRTRVRVSLAA